MAYGELSFLQSRAQPLPLCSLPVQPFAGMSRQSALPRRQQTTTSLGAPPLNGDWPLIFGLNFLLCNQLLPLRLHCDGSASSTRPGPHAQPRPWLCCCLAGIGLHLILFGGDTHQCVLRGQSTFLWRERLATVSTVAEPHTVVTTKNRRS